MKSCFILCVAALLIAGCCTSQKTHTAEPTIAMADAPPAVRASFDRAYPGASVKGVEKENENGMDHYEIKYVGNDGKDHEIEFDSNGKILADK